ncbi:Sigma-70, region 4 [Belnapia rosea]|uniref:Sigma-70, region 4 n=2 Tax=Belnapia rosea TaxID=938405 RepID=A0A1G6V9C5_9PROT|nr:Sigma-70, region 4 [Belnapia rosea]
MGFLAIRRFGTKLSAVRVDPLPLEGTGRTLHWLCFGAQEEVSDWRASDQRSEAVLAAVVRWIEGGFQFFGGALASTIPLPDIMEAIVGCLDDREKDVIQRRAAGETLEALGVLYGVTRERIRQIETRAIETLAERVVALRASHHPAVLALFGHARRLATSVLVAASEEEGCLREEAKERWIRKALPQSDAEVLLILLRIKGEVEPGIRPVLDPLSTAGFPFQAGRTALQWRDEDVEALRVGFLRLVGSRKRRWSRLDGVCAAAKLSRDTATAVAKFAGLTIQGEWVFEGRLKAGDVRRAALTGVLAGAGRAMHEVELLEELVPLGLSADSALRDIHRALAEDQDTFASDGNAIWQLRAQLGATVEDRRPDHPLLPVPMDHTALKDALAALQAAERNASCETLQDLCADQLDFVTHAGDRLARALAELPGTERASVAQILHPSDEAKLLAWLRVATPRDDIDAAPDGPWPPRILEGLTLLAAFVAAVRATGGSDSAHWTAIFDACGERARGWIFNTQQSARRHILSRLVEVATLLRLRRAFSFQSDPWSTLLTLQAGLLKGDIGALPRWLSMSLPTVAIRQLVAPGPNHSASMACIWNALQAYRRGNIGRDAVSMVSRHSEWWPGWSVDEACRSCTESRPDERPSRSFGDAPSEASPPVPRDPTPVGEVRLARATGGRNLDPQSILASLDVALEPDGHAFSVGLPEKLQVPPGSITLLGEGFRVGGTVQEDGAVRWHAEQSRIRLGLKGAPERVIRLEQGGEVLASHPVRLWATDDYIAAYQLGSGRGRPFDPFVSPLPRSGALAILLHRTLIVSEEADEEHGLNDQYVLKVFRAGLPQRATISCDGEILWEAEHQSETRRVLPDAMAYLALDSVSARWGAQTDLLLFRCPSGFVPHRAYVGAQAMPALPDGASWRFPGFSLLPGMDALRRRGRLDGFLDGERVSVPALVSLAQAPTGAAVREGERWLPLDPSVGFEKAKHGQSRVWACLPQLGIETDWTVFEGPRAIAPYREQGVHVGPQLIGYGEPLRVEPRRFNLNGSGVTLAAFTIDTGVVVGCQQDDERVSLQLTVPVVWTERHKAFAWSEQGITAVSSTAKDTASSELVFSGLTHPVDGVCIFHEAVWLGTGLPTDDGPAAVNAFLANAPGWPETLRLTTSGHLPVLATNPAATAASRLQSDGGKGLVALFSMPKDPASAHVAGRLLETWEAKGKLAEALIEQFLRAIRDGGRPVTLLDRLVTDAPCSAIRVLAHGLQPVAKRERGQVLETLIRRLLPQDVRDGLASQGSSSFLGEAEAAMLARAFKVTGFDHNFLASKMEASIASLAWATASAPTPSRHDQNLATSLTIAPVRRWLAVHLLARLCPLVR